MIEGESMINDHAPIFLLFTLSLSLSLSLSLFEGIYILECFDQSNLLDTSILEPHTLIIFQNHFRIQGVLKVKISLNK